jgi:hypothetical protein
MASKFSREGKEVSLLARCLSMVVGLFTGHVFSVSGAGVTKDLVCVEQSFRGFLFSNMCDLQRVSFASCDVSFQDIHDLDLRLRVVSKLDA